MREYLDYIQSQRTMTIGERFGQLANSHPSKTALVTVDVFGQETIYSWRQLEGLSNVAARELLATGVTESCIVGICLPNGHDHVIATLAAWKVGALVVPLNPGATERELTSLRNAAGMKLIIGVDPSADLTPRSWESSYLSQAALVAEGVPRSAHSTGGSTGKPRIILREKPWVYRVNDFPSEFDLAIGLNIEQTQLIVLPLYHAGFTRLYNGFALDHTIILMEHFRPALSLFLIEKYRVNCLRIVPAMIRQILDTPNLEDYNLSSIQVIHQGSASCPQATMRAWLNLIGPDKVYDGYSGTERIGTVWIRGDEWLEHPGSVGKSRGSCLVRILDADGSVMEPGEIGEIFLKAPESKQPTYLGFDTQIPESDGFFSLGDVGYVDENEYLYIIGRRDDTINVGGVKVFPAEVESILLEAPGVLDVVVIGRDHPLLGKSVHALIVPANFKTPPSADQLYEHCRSHLSLAKVPTSYEYVNILPRTDIGKIQRSSFLVNEQNSETIS